MPPKKTIPVQQQDEPTEARTSWTMLSPSWAPDFTGEEHFYDGVLKVENGVVQIPYEHPEWASRLFMNGYEFVSTDDAEDFNTTLKIIS